jgi:formylglycine-generating enzyme required for sulfatase activity
VVDLIGDVWEWTSTKANLYPGNKAAIPPEQREMMVFRGGSYGTKMKGTPTTGAYRDWQKPATIHPTLGFRLVREAQ